MPYLNSEPSSLRNQVSRLLNSEGLSLDELTRSSLDLVVFGSRASGLQHHGSDLDMLIVGNARGHKRVGNLDLILVPEGELSTSLRRRTELFRHIEDYGVSLMHDRMLVTSIRDDHAAERKLARLRALIDRALPSWEIFTEAMKLKYLVKFRREAQRYRLLERGSAVPPTAQLDSSVTTFVAIDSTFEDLVSIAAGETVDRLDMYQLLLREAFRCRHSLVRFKAS
jgi:predicted nucleotidyltransferase